MRQAKWKTECMSDAFANIWNHRPDNNPAHPTRSFTLTDAYISHRTNSVINSMQKLRIHPGIISICRLEGAPGTGGPTRILFPKLTQIEQYTNLIKADQIKRFLSLRIQWQKTKPIYKSHNRLQ